MLDTAAAQGVSHLDLPKIVLAIGALGTAAYGLVDATKGFGGGISNRGFGDIKKVVLKLLPRNSSDKLQNAQPDSALATLRANWLDGMALPAQKSIAKALIKLNLNETTADTMAKATGVDATILGRVASKLGTQKPLEQEETDVYGRFDVLLTALLDQGYQRGDQRYRNSAKLLAVPIAVLLAMLGAWTIHGSGFWNLCDSDLWKAIIAGILATPLAPVAKDLSSAIQAGSKLAECMKS